MNPCELNAAIALITNFLFTKLSRKDFRIVNVLVSELGKSMFAMELLRGICEHDKHDL